MKEIISLLVAEVFLCSSILPAWAAPTDFLRPKSASQSPLIQELEKDTAHRDAVQSEALYDLLATALLEHPFLEWERDGLKVKVKLDVSFLSYHEIIVEVYPFPSNDETLDRHLPVYEILQDPAYKPTMTWVPSQGSYGHLVLNFVEDDGGDLGLFFKEVQPSRAMRHVTATRVGSKTIATAHQAWPKETVDYVRNLAASEVGIRHFYGRYPTPEFVKRIENKTIKE